MKKLIIFLMLVALSAAGIAQNKTGSIQEGLTSLSRPFVFTAADSIAGRGGYFIKAGETYYVTITNPQKFLQTQSISSTVLENSGSGWSILITLYGKVNSGDGWTSIGTPITWTSNSSNPVTIANTTPANYNYLKLAYVAAGGTYSAKITALTFKTANAFPYGATLITGTAGATVTGGVVSLNHSSNNAVNIGTGTTTSTVTIGGVGAQTIAVGNGAAVKAVALGSNTSTSATTILSGTTSGILALNASAGAAVTNINTGTSSGLVTIGGGSGTIRLNSSAWGITAAGVASGLTGITTTGATTTGSIIVAQDTCIGGQTTKSVAGIGVLRATAACTLGGLSGGVAGQLLRILNTSATTLKLTHNGGGTQKFMISGASDLTMTGQYNAVTLTFDGTYWYITGKGQ